MATEDGARISEAALPPVVGHRGAAYRAPENTLAGLRAAAALGVQAVEVDVALTADGVPVLLHDSALGRTTSGTGPLAGTTTADLARLDAGAWFDAAFAGEPVPSLGSALLLGVALGLRFNLELKPTSPELAAATATATCVAVAQHWPADRPAPVLSSFSIPALAAARAAAPGLPRALLLAPDAAGGPDDWRRRADRVGCLAIHPHHRLIDAAAVDVLARDGRALAVYTVNDPGRACALWDLGVDAVITDRPDALLAARAALFRES